MSFLDNITPLHRRALGRAGRLVRRARTGSCTYTRPHSLTSIPTDADPAEVDTLEVKDPAASGSTSAVLQGVGGARVVGAIPTGLTLTIGGTDYVVASAASVSYKKITVSLETPLEADALAGDLVTVEDSVVFGPYDCIMKDPEVARVTVEGMVEPLSGTQHAQFFLNSTEMERWPENGDKWFSGSIEGTVLEVWPPDSTGFLTVFVGEGRRPKV